MSLRRAPNDPVNEAATHITDNNNHKDSLNTYRQRWGIRRVQIRDWKNINKQLPAEIKRIKLMDRFIPYMWLWWHTKKTFSMFWAVSCRSVGFYSASFFSVSCQTCRLEIFPFPALPLRPVKEYRWYTQRGYEKHSNKRKRTWTASKIRRGWEKRLNLLGDNDPNPAVWMSRSDVGGSTMSL